MSAVACARHKKLPGRGSSVVVSMAAMLSTNLTKKQRIHNLSSPLRDDSTSIDCVGVPATRSRIPSTVPVPSPSRVLHYPPPSQTPVVCRARTLAAFATAATPAAPATAATAAAKTAQGTTPSHDPATAVITSIYQTISGSSCRRGPAGHGTASPSPHTSQPPRVLLPLLSRPPSHSASQQLHRASG